MCLQTHSHTHLNVTTKNSDSTTQCVLLNASITRGPPPDGLSRWTRGRESKGSAILVVATSVTAPTAVHRTKRPSTDVAAAAGRGGLVRDHCPPCVNMDFIRSPIWVGWLVWTSYGPDRETSLITQRHHWSSTAVGYGPRSESGRYWADRADCEDRSGHGRFGSAAPGTVIGHCEL
jgi:hypothetical protein